MPASPTIAIIGSGFAGLGMAHYLKKAGIDSFTIYEKASGLGGVWRENTYPGAACDVPSHLYSYSFEPHFPWVYGYGKQSEILDYLRLVARKYGIDPHIQYGRQVATATYDEQRALWKLRFTDGESVEAQVLISGVGQLHRPAFPDIPGIERFKGRAFHSAKWEHDYDFDGKTVAALGTGPSAVQFVPEIAKRVKRLHVFQRSPAYCMPKFDRQYSKVERWLLTHVPFLHDLDRTRIFWYVEFVASVIQKNSLVNWLSKSLVRLFSATLMRLQVKDPELRRKLTPDFPIGCKRLLFSNDWLATLARPHVELVTDSIREITEDSLITADGKERKVDAMVYGTGFAATAFLTPMEIRGKEGVSIHDQWKDGAQAYFGVAVAGFPNFFMLYGPNTNLGIGTIIFMLERQQRYIVQCIEALRDQGLRAIEVQGERQREFNAELDRRNQQLVYIGGCNSWYLTNGRNTQNWVGYMSEYGWRMRRPVLEDYRLDPAATA